MTAQQRFETHDIFNQSPPYEDVDLFTSDRPKTFDFGRGDEVYKQRFATHVTPVAAGLLLRPTRANAVRVRTHRLIASSATRLSDVLRAGRA